MVVFPNISPEIFSINIAGIEFALRWYAVSYILGFIVAILLMKYFLRQGKLWPHGTAPMDVDQAESIITYLILGVILGGRLGYVLFYNFEFYLAHPINIIRIWDGGMSFHGGFLGVVIAAVIYCRYNGIRLLSGADLIAVASPPGLLFGRVANFINAELWGKPTSQPWGVIFPGSAAQDCPGVVGKCARHPSQLYEAGLEGLILLVILLLLAFSGAFKRPGLVTGVFIAGYGLSRFLVELVRVPDPQFFSEENPFGFAYVIGDYGLTMGQALSLPMIMVGCLFIMVGQKKKAY